jgi:hypothetical protein
MKKSLLVALLVGLSLPAFAAKTTVSKPTKQDTSDDPLLDTYLSPKIDKAQAIDAAGLHQDKASKQISSGPAANKDQAAGTPNPPDAPSDQSASSTTSTQDGGIVDPTLTKMKKLDGSSITSTGDDSGKRVKIGNDVLPITNLHVVESMRSCPNPVGAHCAAPVSGPSEAWAVGFMSYGAADFDAIAKVQKIKPLGYTGHCWGTSSPSNKTDGGCLWNMWISETPGGNPVSAKCAQTKFMPNGASGPSINWYSSNPAYQAEMEAQVGKSDSSMCELKKADTKYYCNFIATGWDSQYKPKSCDITFSAPLSYSAADNPPEASGAQATFAQ